VLGDDIEQRCCAADDIAAASNVVGIADLGAAQPRSRVIEQAAVGDEALA